jgi:hypothetical protein
MTTIQFAVDTAGACPRVIAYEADANGNKIPGTDGTVDAGAGSQVTWNQVPGGNNTFEVRFYRKGDTSGNPDWAFNQPPNPGAPPQRFLPVGPNTNVLTTLRTGVGNIKWKYTVSVPGSNILPLDPMIIIRQRSSFAVAPVVVAAIGGAVVGALLTYALLVN